jgi:chromosome segregation ATPase
MVNASARGIATVSTLLLGLTAASLLAAALPAGAQEPPPPPTGSAQEDRQIAQRIRQVFLQGLQNRLDLDEEQMATLLPVLEALETQRMEALKRRRGLMMQLRGLAEDPQSENQEIERKLADLEAVDRGLEEAEESAARQIKEMLEPRQRAQLVVFREDFRRRLEDRVADLRRQRRQREAMREGLQPRRGGAGQGREERP